MLRRLLLEQVALFLLMRVQTNIQYGLRLSALTLPTTTISVMLIVRFFLRLAAPDALRRQQRDMPDLFRRVVTPKADELVAIPYRHGGREAAEAFFMEGMKRSLRAMCLATTNVPLTHLLRL